MAEVYAGFLAHTDYHIGRLLDYLEETGLRENTIVVLVSDNGASGEGGPVGSVNECMLFNGMPDNLETNLAMLDELGGVKTYGHYPNGWAMAFNTPFKLWKRYNFNGGTADPCIISWPAGMKARGEIRGQYHHAVDILPTMLDCLGIEAPETIKGHVQSHFDGLSMRYSFDDAGAEGARKTQFYSMLGQRGIWHEGWKAVTTHPPLSGWGEFNIDEWELYHTDVDRAELHDLAAEMPEKVRELVNLWFAEAGRNGAFPLDDRVLLEIALTERPQLSEAREKYVYYPDIAEVPEKQSVNIRNRSYSLGALVDIPARGAQGVLFAHGRALRRARPLRQGRPPALRLQLRRDHGAEDRRHRGHPHGREPDPRGLVRQGRRGSARCRYRNPLAVLRRQEGGRGADQDPAWRVLPRRRRTLRRAGQRRSCHRRLPRRAPLPFHRRGDQTGEGQRERRAVPQPGARGDGYAHARVSNTRAISEDVLDFVLVEE